MTGDAETPLVAVRDLTKYFPILEGAFRRTVGQVRAVDGVDLDIAARETVGLVGESGSGKSTLGRTILRLLEPTGGRVLFEGIDLAGLHARELRRLRARMAMIFQDPYASLNPRLTIGRIVGEPLVIHEILPPSQRQERVRELLHLVGMNPAWAGRYPHEFSGGQRQRIGIARALAASPTFVVCDEPVSALDVSIQAQIVNLLKRLQRELGLTYLFVSHDLSVVKHMSDRVAVMYLGKIVEVASSREIYRRPLHPYTWSLLSAIPSPDPAREAGREQQLLPGEPPSPAHPPSGCRFRTRCPVAQQICAEREPPLEDKETDHLVACHFPGSASRAA